VLSQSKLKLNYQLKQRNPESAPVVKTMSDSVKAAIAISITAAAVVAAAFLL
jgi:hypothetical protein